MRLVSLDPYEFGVLAFGATPTGILAIGLAPVGVIAIGVVPRGVVAVASGAGAGVFSFSAGLSAGVYSRAVGVSFGFNAGAVGSFFRILPERPVRPPVVRLTVSLESILESHDEGWVEVKVDEAGQLLSRRGSRLDAVIPSHLQRKVRRLRGKNAHALLRAREAEPKASGYRAPARGTLQVRCRAIEPDVSRPPARESFKYWGKLAAKLALFAVIALVAGYSVFEQAMFTTMTRQAEVRWPARVTKSEGIDVAPGASCEVKALLHSDGETRMHLGVSIQCGALELFENKSMGDCRVREAAATPQADRFTYQVRCSQKGTPGTKKQTARKGLALDTFPAEGSARVALPGSRPWNVELSVQSLSDPLLGPPLGNVNHRRPPGFEKEVKRRGRISQIRGGGTLAVGDECTARILPVWTKSNCSVRVECGGKVVYGHDYFGDSVCTVLEGKVTKARDENLEKAPEMEVDLVGGKVVIQQDFFGVEIALQDEDG
ncbi:MAG: hypothetical protein HY898_24010 [Deltaproteobacteria bacterium]|nr:hypothetical protein [Deltaproteobacteria bacterium]